MAAGAADLARLAPPAGVTILVFAQTFVRGALTVLMVVLALDVLLLGEAAVGWLTAAVGVGGLIGGAVAGAVLSVKSLARGFVAGLLLWGIPLVALAAVPTPLTAYVALAVVGVGNAVEDVSLFTLMPRAFRPRFVGRALGALELTVFAGIGLGSVAAPVLVDLLGVRAALGALGGGLAGLAALYAVRFIRLDADLPVPGPEAGLLHRNPIFAPLPLATVELLASELSSNSFAPGRGGDGRGRGRRPVPPHRRRCALPYRWVASSARHSGWATGSARSRCSATSRGPPPSRPSGSCERTRSSETSSWRPSEAAGSRPPRRSPRPRIALPPIGRFEATNPVPEAADPSR